MATFTAKGGQDPEKTSLSKGRMAEFLAFIKSARAFQGDLSSISAPAFILSPTSLVEFPSYWCEDPSLFVAPSSCESKSLRSLAVLKWSLRSLQAQWTNRRGMRKKPLNPILGELFLGHWEDDSCGRTELVVEQVSHHPPITAYRIRNDKHGIRLEGYHLQKTYFRGTPHIERLGHVMVHLDAFDEDYLLTLPKMHLEGLIPPPPYPELEGKSFIVGSNGMRADIEYSGRGWWRGRKNSFHARLWEEAHPERTMYTAEGQWQHGEFAIYDDQGTQVDVIETRQPLPPSTLCLKPSTEQSPLETRRVWGNVAAAIERGDMRAVSREKHAIEEDQRAMRRKEREEGIDWKPRYFQPGAWKAAEELLARIGQGMRVEETKGIWRWKDS